MKKVLFGAAVAALGLSSCGSGQLSEVKTLSTLQDSVSYAYGAMIGESVRTQVGSDNEDFNFITYASAMQTALEGGEVLMNKEVIQATLQNYFTKVKPAKDLAIEATFVEELKAANSNIITTESGLMYEIIEAGDATNMPLAVDTVAALYTGKFINGDIFDSTANRDNKPTEFPLNGVIKGWTEGIQLIGKGGKIKLWIPRDLAYGDKLMTFDVEIVDVKKLAAVEAE